MTDQNLFKNINSNNHKNLPQDKLANGLNDMSLRPDALDGQYKDLGGVTLKKLNIGLWYLENREKFKKGLLYFLIGICVLAWGYIIVSVIYYFTFGMSKDNEMVRQIVTNGLVSHDVLLTKAAQDIAFGSPEVFDLDNGKYDFVTEIKNPNKDFYAEIEYIYNADGQDIASGKTFILPEETKNIILLGKALTYRPQKAMLKTSNIKWQRIDKHIINDWEDYKNSHLNISVENVSFVGSRDSGILQAAGLNNLEFDVANKTPYNYWQVDFSILLYSGDSLAAVNRYGLTEFMSGTSRKVKMSWPGTFNRITNIKIVPELDIMQNDIYIKFQGDKSIGEDQGIKE